MGLFRGLAWWGSGGLVRPVSKKQWRHSQLLDQQRAQTRELRRQTQLMQVQAQAAAPPPPGWYPTADATTLQYWDGSRWTGEVRYA